MQAEVLLGDRLAGRRELGHRAERRRLRRLAAGVRVDLGVEHQDVDVAAARRARGRGRRSRCRRPSRRRRRSRRSSSPGSRPRLAGRRASGASMPREPPLRARRPARAAARDRRLRSDWSALEQIASTSSSPMPPRSRSSSSRGVRGLRVDGQPHAEAELGVVLEQRVGPGRAAAVAVRASRRRRQVAAVDRRAAGGVGDQQPVAEELGQQLEVRRLAAAGAGAGELEQRLAGTASP